MIALAEQLAELVAQLGTAQTLKIARLLSAPSSSWAVVRSEALAIPSDPPNRLALERLLAAAKGQGLEAPVLAMALHGAARAAQKVAEARQVDLVWSGPESRTPPARLTEQAVAELIASTRSELLLVTYTLHRIDSLVPTLKAVVARDIKLTLILEDRSNSGEMTLAALKKLAQAHPAFRNYYIWPREHDRDGVKNLHVKAMVSDRKRMLLGSANFTKAAMERNMELGVLIQGGPEPEEVTRHFESLIAQGTLIPQRLS